MANYTDSRPFPPQVRLGRLYEKTSKSTGNVYLSGRIGFARVIVVKSRDRADDDTGIWDILLSQAPEKAKTQDAAAEAADAHVRREPVDEGL